MIFPKSIIRTVEQEEIREVVVKIDSCDLDNTDATMEDSTMDQTMSSASPAKRTCKITAETETFSIFWIIKLQINLNYLNLKNF